MSTSNNLELTNPTGPYTYSQELKGENIRLIKLTHGLESEQLCCSLVYKHLADKDLKYPALSYVWGDKSSPVVILCDGLPFEITRNLHQLLSQLRGTMEEEYLWADAVCIDQATDVEKTAQVRLMTKIHSRAELVLIWLGEEQATDKDGLQLMLEVHNLLGWSEECNGTDPIDLEASALPDVFDPSWDALVNILTRQWFTRMWPIQELIVAHEAAFLCGQNKIPSSLILSVGALFVKNTSLRWVVGVRATAISASSYYHLIRLYARYGPLNLLHLLWFTRRFETAESRDKIFALVGLTEDVENEFIDYERNLRDILVDLAERILTNDLGRLIKNKPLCLLSYVEARPQSSDLPSWVPDWKARGSCRPLGLIFAARKSSDDGNGYFSVNANKTLVVRGNRIDRLKVIVQSTQFCESAVGLTLDDLLTMIPQVQSWFEHISQLLRKHSCHSRYENVAETFCRTMCFDAGVHDPASPDMAAAFEAWQKIISLMAQKKRSLTFHSKLFDFCVILSSTISGGLLGYGLMDLLFRRRLNVYKTLVWLTSWIGICWLVNQGIDAADALKPRDPFDAENIRPYISQLQKESAPFERTFGEYALDRRFCITERGYMGWVCLSAREGDEVVALCGTRILYTIRREDEGVMREDKGVRLTGDCYLQGLMNGGWTPKEEIRII